MFNKNKKIIVLFANIAFMFTSIVPNSVTMGMMENLDTSASSSSSGSSSGDLILQPDDNANNLQNSGNNSNDLSEVSCCEKCCTSFCNCFCDSFVQRHPYVATLIFITLGSGILYGIESTLS